MELLKLLINPDYFSGIATIFTGVIAWVIYWRTKRTQKKDAACIILSEIRNAETSIHKIIETEKINTFTSILPVNSWNTYKHLFINDFSIDNFKLIESFYLRCVLSEKQVAIFNNFSTIAAEERARIIQSELLKQLVAVVTKDTALADDLILKEYQKNKEKITKVFHDENYWYEDYRPRDQVFGCIRGIEFVLNSVPGEKLRKISDSLF